MCVCMCVCLYIKHTHTHTYSSNFFIYTCYTVVSVKTWLKYRIQLHMWYNMLNRAGLESKTWHTGLDLLIHSSFKNSSRISILVLTPTEQIDVVKLINLIPLSVFVGNSY